MQNYFYMNWNIQGDFQIYISVPVIPRHFSRFKNYEVLILKLVSGISFSSAEMIRAFVDIPAGNYMFKVNNRNTKTKV